MEGEKMYGEMIVGGVNKYNNKRDQRTFDIETITLMIKVILVNHGIIYPRKTPIFCH